MARHADRVLFPATLFGTADLAEYYRKVARKLLPHLKNVPVSFRRFPDTVDGQAFWEKDKPSFAPSWVKTLRVPRKSGESDIHYVLANDVKTLVWIAEVGGIEIHPFLSRAPNMAVATGMVFDLDPGQDADIVDCCRVALLLREALQQLDLQSLPKVSGSKGLQVLVPLNGTLTHAQTLAVSQFIAEHLAAAHPDLVTAKMSKQLRSRKVFIDWSQNVETKTNVSVYSVRAKRWQPFVSMPVTWEEVEEADVEGLFFTPQAALERIADVGDLFAPALTLRQSIPDLPAAASGLAASKASREKEFVVNGIRLPKRQTQSGRRLFMLQKRGRNDELWLHLGDVFQRWMVEARRPDGSKFVARPLKEAALQDAWFHGKVPAGTAHARIEDIGSYELIEGAYELGRLDLFFTGTTLQGEWRLEKTDDGRQATWSFTKTD